MSGAAVGTGDLENEEACLDWGADPDDRYYRASSVLEVKLEPSSAWVEERAVECDGATCVSDEPGAQAAGWPRIPRSAVCAAVGTGQRLTEAPGRCWRDKERPLTIPSD
jgi:hypothetical protein